MSIIHDIAAPPENPVQPSPTPTAAAEDVTQVNIQKIILLVSRGNEYEEAGKRARIDAAKLMAQQIDDGMPATELYSKVKFTRKTGAEYMALAKAYEGMPAEELDRLQREGKLLSLSQAVALKAAIERSPECDRQRISDEVLKKSPPPKQIENLVPRRDDDDLALRERLNITDQDIEAARAGAPVRPVCEAVVEADRVIVHCSHPTPPQVFAAITQNAGVYLRVAELIKNGGIIEVRRSI